MKRSSRFLIFQVVAVSWIVGCTLGHPRIDGSVDPVDVRLDELVADRVDVAADRLDAVVPDGLDVVDVLDVVDAVDVVDVSTCQDATVACDGGCVQTQTDPMNCGGCGLRCPNCQTCVAGVCAPASPRLTDCSGTCVDLNTSVANCSMCARPCVLANATPACTAGTCTVGMCTAGFADCDTMAANGCEATTATDVRNCGTCGTMCPAGFRCTAGRCQAPRSCQEIHMLLPLMTSGMFGIDPDADGTVASVYCDMATDGGGWTLVFQATSNNLNSIATDYTYRDTTLLAAAANALIVFRHMDRSAFPNWVRFGMPTDWRTQSPLAVPAGTAAVTGFAGATPFSTTLRYGFGTFPSSCADNWAATGIWGRICLVGVVNSPDFRAFADSAADYCLDNMVVPCTPDRIFTIAVR